MRIGTDTNGLVVGALPVVPGIGYVSSEVHLSPVDWALPVVWTLMYLSSIEMDRGPTWEEVSKEDNAEQQRDRE